MMQQYKIHLSCSLVLRPHLPVTERGEESSPVDLMISINSPMIGLVLPVSLVALLMTNNAAEITHKNRVSMTHVDSTIYTYVHMYYVRICLCFGNDRQRSAINHIKQTSASSVDIAYQYIVNRPGQQAEHL